MPLLHSQPACIVRGLQTSAALADDIKIVVPSMGDSISEGTVASVAKQAGTAADSAMHAAFIRPIQQESHRIFVRMQVNQ